MSALPLIPLKIVKISELRSKSGEVLGTMIKGEVPGDPPEGLANLGGLSLFIPASTPSDLSLGQQLVIGVVA